MDCIFLWFFFPQKPILFWGHYLMHHVLGHFSTLAGSKRNSSFERKLFQKLFFQCFFHSLVFVFFSHMCTWLLSQRFKETLLQISEALPLCRPLFLALSSLNSEHCLLNTARPLVSVSVSLPCAVTWKLCPDREWENLLGSPCLFLFSRIIVLHCVQCLKTSVSNTLSSFVLV